MSRNALLLALALLALAPAGALAKDDVYEVLYDVRMVPTERAARVVIRLGANAHLVRELTLRIDPQRHFDFRGDGEVTVVDDSVHWKPPEAGGQLRYTFLVDHLRDDRSYDARCTKTWALFRGDDLVPPTRSRVQKGARSHSLLRLRVPEGWSRATPYPLLRGGVYGVNHPHRGFDRPTGWFVVGHLGAVREEVHGVEVAIAAPKKHGMRRLDMLALLRWTLPVLEDVLGELPPRLLVVGAGDPMWRGGLSGPQSVYVHARRPLIGEDGTSPLLHEVMHALLGIRGGDGGDWVVEGLAELYAIEMLRRSGTLAEDRVERIYQKLATRGRRAAKLEVDSASGDVTARAVVALRALDAEIRERSEGAHSLDEVVRRLTAQRDPVTTASLGDAVLEATGLDLGAFLRRLVRPQASSR
ncbi:MAG: hypothetical protein ACQGVC_14915 [Myxococcota bacterium]